MGMGRAISYNCVGRRCRRRGFGFTFGVGRVLLIMHNISVRVLARCQPTREPSFGVLNSLVLFVLSSFGVRVRVRVAQSLLFFVFLPGYVFPRFPHGTLYVLIAILI